MDGNTGLQQRRITDHPLTERYNAPADTVRQVEGGSVTAALAGAGALVLAILGLIGVAPITLASVATIAAGAAVLFTAGSLATEVYELLNARGRQHTRNAMLGGLSVESIAGLGGIVLGILALLGVQSVSLLATATIVLGAALLIGSGTQGRLEQYLGQTVDSGRRAAHYADYAASAADVVIGGGAVVLGIIAFTSSGITVSLVLIAMLAIGIGTLAAGSSLAARMATMMR